MRANFNFAKNRPDVLAEQLAALLSETKPLAFNDLFEKLQAALASTGSKANGDMLRLRTHEKLQKFLRTGLVTKNGKEYTGVKDALSNFLKTTTEQKAHRASSKQKRAAQHPLSEAVEGQPPASKPKPLRKRKSPVL